MRIKNPTDFWTGLLFGGFGAFVSYYAAVHYKIGTAVRMGPGYFPTAIGALVAILGLALAISALRVEGPRLPRLHLRPLAFVLLGIVAYGYVLRPLGMVIATAALVVVSALGGHEFRWREAIPLAIGLAVFSILVFVWGLGLPFSLWPEFLE